MLFLSMTIKIQLRGGETTEFEIADVNDLDAPLAADQAERIDESTAEIDYVIEDTHLGGNYANDTGEINVIGDETDNIK